MFIIKYKDPYKFYDALKVIKRRSNASGKPVVWPDFYYKEDDSVWLYVAGEYNGEEWLPIYNRSVYIRSEFVYDVCEMSPLHITSAQRAIFDYDALTDREMYHYIPKDVFLTYNKQLEQLGEYVDEVKMNRIYGSRNEH